MAIAQSEFDELAAQGEVGELNPRQRLVLCLVLLRGGNAVRAERIEQDLEAWKRKYGEPTAATVAKWVRKNQQQIVFGVEEGVRRNTKGS